MDNRKKLLAIKAKLGHPKESRSDKGEYGFLCPGKPGSGGCSSASQGKVRMWVNPENNTFHCWHCGYGNGGSLAALMQYGSIEQREYVGWLGDTVLTRKTTERPQCNTLPDGFTPFRLSGSHNEAPYLHYLLSRGVSTPTVALYRMGYIDDGKLAGRVVIPSFDRNGSINFWSARSIYPTQTLRYRLPEASKNIISNEHMVDWSKDVFLVEGIFDEIAIGPQGISLYGKFMPFALALRLVEQHPPVVNVCLDTDAKPEALDLVRRLISYGLSCRFVDLDDKDPSSAGSISVESAAAKSTVISDIGDFIGMML